MKVIARICGENQELLNNIKSGNINARLVKNAIIADLVMVDNDVYMIPDLILRENTQYFIECTEFYRNSTPAQVTIICDKAGKPMRPYYIPKVKSVSNGECAYFAVPLCISIEIVKEDGIVTITEHSLNKMDNKIILKHRKLWYGLVQELPNIFSRFKVAIDKGFEKLNDSKNITACYIQDNRREN